MTAPGQYRQDPAMSLSEPRELLDAHLDSYRDAVLRKLDGLSDEQLRTSRLPSGWTPLGLLKHLAWVERRWLRWGFAGEHTERPWGDRGPAGDWYVPAEETAEQVRALFLAECARSRRAVAGAPLHQRARVGGRFPTEADAPTLSWILFHLLQEYARHVGHLDVVRELTDGDTGE